MNCPRCQKLLATKVYEAGVEVGECPNCRGVWLDEGELQRIEETEERDHSEALRTPENTVERSFQIARQRALPDISCPKCGSAMEKKECHYASGVLVDVCPECAGYWLDRSELESLETFSQRMRGEEQRDQQRGFFAGLRRLLGD